MSPTDTRRWFRRNPEATEAAIWLAGLSVVAVPDPAHESFIELCLFKLAGFPWCPGCGLGHAVGFLVRGDWSEAVASHAAAPFVVAVLLIRIATLLLSVRRRR